MLFFRGAGVEGEIIRDFEAKLKHDPESVYKYDIAREILSYVNEMGWKTIRERREIVKRVTEFEDFSTCWPDDQLAAKGLVAEVRNVVNVKDSFTRINLQRDAEVSRRRDEQRVKDENLRQRQEKMASIKRDLYELVIMDDPRRRGTLFEDVLNRLFEASEILVRDGFRRTSELAKGVIEQIDGVIELEGHIYLVEAKWLKEPVEVPDVSQHLSRLFLRGEGRGIFISYSGFTKPAIEVCREALTKKCIVLCTLQEIVLLLERQCSLEDFLKGKIRRAVIEKDPFCEFL